MNKFFLALLTILTFQSAQALQSQIPSSIPGLETPNVHAIDTGVYRGNAPLGEFEDLRTLEITSVLIFKNEVKTEVQDEIEQLTEMGYAEKNIKNVPFQWKEFDDYQSACEQIVDALSFIRKARQNGNVFFHCTVGEDRTGALAGLYRMQYENWTLEHTFKDEMCARGYEAGDQQKPKVVVAAIRRDLTPLFLAVAKRIEENGKVTRSMCADLQLPEASATSRYTCK